MSSSSSLLAYTCVPFVRIWISANHFRSGDVFLHFHRTNPSIDCSAYAANPVELYQLATKPSGQLVEKISKITVMDLLVCTIYAFRKERAIVCPSFISIERKPLGTPQRANTPCFVGSVSLFANASPRALLQRDRGFLNSGAIRLVGKPIRIIISRLAEQRF